MALSKRELVEALAPFPDDALIDAHCNEIGDSECWVAVVAVEKFDEKFGYITLGLE